MTLRTGVDVASGLALAAAIATTTAAATSAAAAPATSCPRCGQLTATAQTLVCASCRRSDHQPQGQAMHLFAPAPNVMAGQLHL